MSLKRLAVRTKKSLSGLRGGFGNDRPSPPETPKKQMSPQSGCSDPGFDEFGMLPFSPSKDSASKRNRLMGSWRRMMANFESSKHKEVEESVAQPVTPLNHTPSRKRPSLALNFEVSPPDKPMFSSPDSSALEVHRSFPIAVPRASKPTTPPDTTELPMGTIPDTPAPLHKESVQRAILSRSREATAEPVERAVKAEPVLTPMPGTNLTLNDIQPPAIVVSSPKVSLNKDEGYFAIPLIKNDSREARPIKVPVSGFLGVQHSRSRTEPLPSDEIPTNFDFDKTVIVANEMFNDDLDAEARKSLEGKHDFASAYLALEGREVPTDDAKDIPYQSHNDPGRRRSTWSRNTGLYDGTGYASPGLIDDTVEEKNSTTRVVAGESAEDAEYDADSESAVPQSSMPSPPPEENAPVEEIPVDEKEALHEIIQAYAFSPSMISDDDQEQAIEDALKDIEAKQGPASIENTSSNAQQNAQAGGFFESAMRMQYDGLARERRCYANPRRSPLLYPTSPRSDRKMSNTVILGSGIIGVSTAYYLSQSSHISPDSIHLVDPIAELFHCASGFAGGYLASDWFAPSVASLGALSFRLHKELADKHNGRKTWGYSQSTGISYSLDEEAAVGGSGEDWLSSGTSRAQAAGAHSDANSDGPIWLKKADGATMEVISKNSSTAQIDPLRLCRFLLDQCLERGVHLHQPARILSVAKDENNQLTGVRISKDGAEMELPCTHLVITSGAWSPRVLSSLFPKATTRIPVSALGGHSLLIRNHFYKQDAEEMCHAVFATDTLGFSPEWFARVGGDGGEIYLAGLNSTMIPLPDVATDAKVNPEAVKQLRDCAAAMLGTVDGKEVEVIRESLCFRPVTGSGRPIISRIPDQKLESGFKTRPGGEGGVFVAAGHGAWGISQSLGTGYVLTELVEGRKTSANLAALGLP
ncbi:DAO-domain-containing protein [Lophiostoma macrostomum CBS 122681]|uniref:DAO-domain-containing protein n=1 Tax=Lophiostoma macrostomum CBS 122681 TaxID=1314788 RepID=A0A6A6TD77_9PLEO|nr:DAO-domain-containing protein [Lophiostoma macrostomum CBS 122681]